MNIQYSTEDLCSICREPYEDSIGHDAFRLECEHAYGQRCIKKWAKKNATCPTCRQKTFPPELSGGSYRFQRLLNRTIFIADPPELNIGPCAATGLGLGFIIGTCIYFIAGHSVESFICPGVFGGVGILRGISAGRDGLASCAYLIGASVSWAASSLLMSQIFG